MDSRTDSARGGGPRHSRGSSSSSARAPRTGRVLSHVDLDACQLCGLMPPDDVQLLRVVTVLQPPEPASYQGALFEQSVGRLKVIVYAFDCDCGATQIVRPFDRVAIVATPEGVKRGEET